MSRVICVMGESGSGKTTSMRNLDPKTTFYIDADRKGLSWKGWRSQYSKDKCNYMSTDLVETVWVLIGKINKQDNMKHIKTVIIDTVNGLMIADEMRRCKEKGYDKWQDLAQCVWDLVVECHSLRDDLTVIFLAHTQTERDENGFSFTRIKTSGKKLDKIVLESKFTTVLLSKEVDGNFVFETHANNSTAKTPLGAFEEGQIENDIVKVLEVLEEY